MSVHLPDPESSVKPAGRRGGCDNPPVEPARIRRRIVSRHRNVKCAADAIAATCARRPTTKKGRLRPMRKFSPLIFVIALSLAVPAAAQAPQGAPEGTRTRIRGTVEKL